MFTRSLGLSCLLVFGLALPSAAQIVQGRVVDDNTSLPITAVQVSAVNNKGQVMAQAMTDSIGFFRMVVPEAGNYTLQASRIGYTTQSTQPIGLADQETLTVTIQMSAAAILLDPLEVVERRRAATPALAEFYERADRVKISGFGRIYTREEFRRAGNLTTIYRLHHGGQNCPTAVVVDNLPVDDPASVEFMVPPDAVEGIEFYRRQEIPSEFLHFVRNEACNLMLVWTHQPAGEGEPYSLKRLLFIGGVLGILFFGLGLSK